MADLLLDQKLSSPTFQDLVITSGDLVLNGDGTQAILQDMLSALRFFAGEWFLDLSQGIDYFGVVFVKNPDMGAINAVFIAQLLAVPGTFSVTRFESITNFFSRGLAVSFSALTTAGKVDYAGTIQ